jgi:hypothetical protein
MGIQFSQLYIVDGAILGFHDLSSRQQRLVIEVRTSIVECIVPLDCPQHPLDRILVHSAFKVNAIHNTLVLCCTGFQETVRSALGSCPFDCSCICLEQEGNHERDH